MRMSFLTIWAWMNHLKHFYGAVRLGAPAVILAFGMLLGFVPTHAEAKASYTLFESGQVRPLAVSPDGRYLYAANTPDNRLEVFRIHKTRLQHRGSIPVGMEPVALAARTNDEVWVVNHMSDSISIVDTSNPAFWRVTRTLQVGDEPRDIVFAGPSGDLAFVTTAHRGQNRPGDPQLTTPGVGRADVWVFDANEPGNSTTGGPETILTFFTDTPRALAVSPDGNRVYAAGFHTGNQTTTINEFVVKEAVANSDRIYPPPYTNAEGEAQPSVALIVKFDGAHWVDELGQTWDDVIPFNLPDKDVFTIDATTDPPSAVVGPGGEFPHVGTILFNMVANPVSGKVYVSNTQSFNEVRFEGPGDFTGSSVRGHLAESRISVLDSNGGVTPRHLNKHIDYSACCDAVPNMENRLSVAFPMDMAISADGKTLYVAAFGSSEIAVYDTADLEDDTFTPDLARQFQVSGGGPSGVVLHEATSRLFVLTRFDNGISVLDADSGAEVEHIRMYNPEPAHIVKGRPFLYDASLTSSHGDSACASCHIFGDFDSLAWDLGDPDFFELTNTGPFKIPPEIGFFLLRGAEESPHFRPMKGPMTTQSLRGMDNHGSMHWRGDRNGGHLGDPNVQPNSGAFDEQEAFRQFNPAFVGLVGRDTMLPADDMQAFTDFIIDLMYPPNPVRNLDNSDTFLQTLARDFYTGEVISDTFHNCNGCHVLDPAGNAEHDVAHPGFFGTDGQFSFEGEGQFFKISHLRNMYQKVGMFGMGPGPDPFEPGPLGRLLFLPLDNVGHMGDQVRGFGFLHDGSVDTLFRFVSNTLFLPRAPGTIPSLDPRTPPEMVPDPGNGGMPLDANGILMRRALEDFMLAFPSNHAPVVGQQVTFSASSGGDIDARADLLVQRADAGDCDLIAKGRLGAGSDGYLYVGGGLFITDRSYESPVADANLRSSASHHGAEVTYTCVPLASGTRMGIDRDEDGIFDGDE
jgi:YVTN family beta-propeller protein